MKRLTIISHTNHYTSGDGSILGFGPTVTEINNLLDIFDEIYHVAMLNDTEAPLSALPYTSDKIKFVPLPAVGGIRFIDKLSIIWKAPRILSTIRSTLKHSDYFQFRAPTGIGVFVVPYLVFFNSKKGWFKYAGNWVQENPPLSYRFQRWLLKRQKRSVTINGSWSNQSKHCLTFENPCLTEQDLLSGKEIVKHKIEAVKVYDFCFVGRLEEEKGVSFLINALKNINASLKSKIGKVHLVGDGKKADDYKALCKESEVDFIFYGFLSRKDVHDIYKKSHAIILPSQSEGFPKVIAEAMNFGCIPIVSNVSSISHYVKDNVNGFLLKSINEREVEKKIEKLMKLSFEDYKSIITAKENEFKKFGYSYYNKRILNDLI